MDSPEKAVTFWAIAAALGSALLTRGIPAVWKVLTGAVSAEAAALREQLAVANERVAHAEKAEDALRESLGDKVDTERRRAERAEVKFLQILTWLRAKYPDEAELFEDDSPTGIHNVVKATKPPTLSPDVEKGLERYNRDADPFPSPVPPKRR